MLSELSMTYFLISNGWVTTLLAYLNHYELKSDLTPATWRRLISLIDILIIPTNYLSLPLKK
ncbi:MAG: hypothetical protein IPH77_20880 [Ignavibacteria bacterium]|nr:hypothetical protein [Ignavibacteria bacterium]